MKDSSVIPGVSDDNGPGSTSSSLLAGVRANHSEAWRRFTALYGPLVYGWSRRAGLRAEDAADVTQDVFLALVPALGSFRRDRPGDSLRGWLFTVTRSKLNDFWRRQAQRSEAAGGTDALQRFLRLADDAEASGCSAPRESSALLRRALDLIRGEFEERSWQAFWRVTIEGRRAADVAAELQVTPNAVYVARSRILRRLRDELGADLDGS